MDFILNKHEFRDAVKLHYDWPIPECPSIYVCGANFSVDHAMVCKRGGLVIQPHNEVHDLEAELLEMVCSDVQIEPSLQPVTREKLNSGANKENDLNHTNYVGYTTRHLFQRVADHRYSAIGRHLRDTHGNIDLLNESQFRTLKKCSTKWDCCLLYTSPSPRDLSTSRMPSSA